MKWDFMQPQNEMIKFNSSSCYSNTLRFFEHDDFIY